MPLPIVRIKEPCQEDWSAMTPNAQGRHCAQCRKTVVDFTGWRSEDILNYLRKNAEKKICGRFSTEQAVKGLPELEVTPAQAARYIRIAPLTYLQRVAAVILIGLSVVLGSCAGSGKDQDESSLMWDTARVQAPPAPDSTVPMIMGAMMPPQAGDTTHALTQAMRACVPEPGVLAGAPVPIDVQGVEPVSPQEPLPIKDTTNQAHTMGEIEVRLPDTARIPPVGRPAVIQGQITAPKRK